jgi:hypothetical protein
VGWAQPTLVEDDPGNYDPQFWLDYFKRTHSGAARLAGSSGGLVLSAIAAFAIVGRSEAPPQSLRLFHSRRFRPFMKRMPTSHRKHANQGNVSGRAFHPVSPAAASNLGGKCSRPQLR